MNQTLRFEHDALFYETEDAFVGTLVPFLREGMERGEGTVAATTRSNIGLLREELGADAAAMSFIEHEDWYVRPARTIAGWAGVLNDLLAKGHGYVRIVGEVRFGTTADEHASWTRYESALNRAFADAPAWIVCPYDARAFPEQLLQDAQRTHPMVWNGNRGVSERYVDPAALLTEIPEPAPRTAGTPLVNVPLDGNLAEVRRIVREAARGARVPSYRVDDLLLALNEVATNSVRHGRGPAGLALWILDDRIVCEVSDHGDGLADALAGYVPPAREAESGMGLWVAHQLCDGFAIDAHGHGTTVRLSIHR